MENYVHINVYNKRYEEVDILSATRSQLTSFYINRWLNNWLKKGLISFYLFFLQVKLSSFYSGMSKSEELKLLSL